MTPEERKQNKLACNKRWREKNKERIAEYNKLYNKNNSPTRPKKVLTDEQKLRRREYFREYQRIRKERDPEKIKEYNRNYYHLRKERNPEKINEIRTYHRKKEREYYRKKAKTNKRLNTKYVYIPKYDGMKVWDNY